MANFCSECGNKFPTSSVKFCPECGIAQPNLPVNDSLEEKIPNLSKVETNSDLVTELGGLLDWNYSPRKVEGISEGAYSWKNAHLTAIQYAAPRWFSKNVPLISATQIIAKLSLETFVTPSTPEELSPLVYSAILDDCEPISWKESHFGKEFIQILGSMVTLNELNMGLSLSIEASPLLTGKLPDLDFNQPIPLTHNQDYYTGIWKTSGGQPFAKFAQLFRSKSTQKEYVYWHINALVRTRLPMSERHPHPSTFINIPATLQTALYLGETSFPGVQGAQMNVTNREREFGNIDESLIPKPEIRSRFNSHILYIDESDGVFYTTRHYAPESISLGYLFDASSTKQLVSSIFATCDSALNHVQDILLDGYSNYGSGNPLDFQAWLSSDALVPDPSKPGHDGLLVPGIIYGGLCERTDHIFSKFLAQGDTNPDGNFGKLIRIGAGRGYIDAALAAADYLFSQKFYHRDLQDFLGLIAVGDYIEGLDLEATIRCIKFDTGYPEHDADQQGATIAKIGLEKVRNSIGYPTESIATFYECYYEIHSKLKLWEPINELRPEVNIFVERNPGYKSLEVLYGKFA